MSPLFSFILVLVFLLLLAWVLRPPAVFMVACADCGDEFCPDEGGIYHADTGISICPRCLKECNSGKK